MLKIIFFNFRDILNNIISLFYGSVDVAPIDIFDLFETNKNWTKNKKIFRSTDPNFFWHVSGNMGIFLDLTLIVL